LLSNSYKLKRYTCRVFWWLMSRLRCNVRILGTLLKTRAERDGKSVVVQNGVLIIDNIAIFRWRKVIFERVSLFLIMETINSSLVIAASNCRGFNTSKIPYINDLLQKCNFLFIQEHWLSNALIESLSGM
jgi:hypothetical protein